MKSLYELGRESGFDFIEFKRIVQSVKKRKRRKVLNNPYKEIKKCSIVCRCGNVIPMTPNKLESLEVIRCEACGRVIERIGNYYA